MNLSLFVLSLIRLLNVLNIGYFINLFCCILFVIGFTFDHKEPFPSEDGEVAKCWVCAVCVDIASTKR